MEEFEDGNNYYINEINDNITRINICSEQSQAKKNN